MLALEAAKGIPVDPLAALSQATNARLSRTTLQVSHNEVSRSPCNGNGASERAVPLAYIPMKSLLLTATARLRRSYILWPSPRRRRSRSTLHRSGCTRKS